MSDIIAAVSDVTGVSVIDMESRRRGDDLFAARWVSFLLGKRMTRASLYQIGRPLCRDHTTVHHGLRRAVDLEKTNPEFRDLVTASAARAREICDARIKQHMERKP